MTAVETALVTALAPTARQTEAFTWAGTAVFVGYSAGAAIAGLVAAHGGGLVAAALSATALVGSGAMIALMLLPRAQRAPASRSDVLP